MIEVTFYGVRGSTPCNDPATARYGGNTSCVLVKVGDEPPIVLDLGAGARYLGLSIDDGDDDHRRRNPFSGTALVSHVHWDHIMGLPFFGPVLQPGANLRIVGPKQDGITLADAFDAAVRPPLFPVCLDQLPGSFEFHETSDGTFEIGSASVTVFPVVHVGPTNGYRLDAGTGSVAYVSDCQQPHDGSLVVDQTVINACRGVDLLIHDAQYDPDEFAVKSDWGHCTVDYAVEVARAADVGCLVLYHHDPTHDDAWVDAAVEQATERAAGAFEVVAASEGLTLRSGG